MISNLTALVAARERALPASASAGSAVAAPRVYCSAEAHYCVQRAAEVLGIGAAQRALDRRSTTGAG